MRRQAAAKPRQVRPEKLRIAKRRPAQPRRGPPLLPRCQANARMGFGRLVGCTLVVFLFVTKHTPVHDDVRRYVGMSLQQFGPV